MRLFALGLMAATLASPLAHARILWRGDFETGDVSQWSEEQSVAFDRLKIKANPVREGKYALEVTVKPGDNPIRASGNRNELVYSDDRPAGEERVYAWSTMWPSDYTSAPTWQLFTQWHHDTGGGSPPVEFYVNGETVYLRISGEVVWTTPLERGRWHDFVFRVKWATDGWVELSYDGVPVLARMKAKTLYPGQGVYLKQGLYRSASVRKVQRIFHDGMIVATSLDDVKPAPAAAPTVTPAAATTTPMPVTAVTAVTTDTTDTGAATVSNEVKLGASGCETTLASAWGLAPLALLFAKRRRRSLA